MNTLRKSKLKMDKCNKKLTVFTTIADELKKAGMCNTCVKCKNNLNPHHVLSSLSANVTVINTPFDDSPHKLCTNELHYSITDEHKTVHEYLGATKVAWAVGAHSAQPSPHNDP